MLGLDLRTPEGLSEARQALRPIVLLSVDPDAANHAVGEVLTNAVQHGNGIIRVRSRRSTAIFVSPAGDGRPDLGASHIGLSMVEGMRSRWWGGQYVTRIDLKQVRFAMLDLAGFDL